MPSVSPPKLWSAGLVKAHALYVTYAPFFQLVLKKRWQVIKLAKWLWCQLFDIIWLCYHFQISHTRHSNAVGAKLLCVLFGLSVNVNVNFDSWMNWFSFRFVRKNARSTSTEELICELSVNTLFWFVCRCDATKSQISKWRHKLQGNKIIFRHILALLPVPLVIRVVAESHTRVTASVCLAKSFIRSRFNCRFAKVLVNSLTQLKLQPEFDQYLTDLCVEAQPLMSLSAQTKASPPALLSSSSSDLCIFTFPHSGILPFLYFSCSVFLFSSFLLEGTGLLQWLSRLEACLWLRRRRERLLVIPSSRCVPSRYAEMTAL